MVNLNLRQIRVIFLTVAFGLLAGGIGYSLGSQKVKVSLNQVSGGVKIERTVPADYANLDFSLFWSVWDRLSANYLDKAALKPAEMIYGAIRGMTAALGDPYTVFLPPTENKQTKEDLNGAFEGVGIQLGYQDGNLVVVSPLKGMPAEKAGIKAGDFILKIGDKEATGLSLPEAVNLIRGPAGTKVKLTLLREGEPNPSEKELIRQEIVVPSVEIGFEDNLAVLKLSRFGDRTDEEWGKAVDEILGHQPMVAGLILDLRNNPGGYLSGSIFTASEFMTSGVVVQQEHANGQRENFSVDRKGKLINLPLVVLVNKGSASASEILAGALQEHKRAKIVGEKTFGKGTIQEAQELPSGAGLHITTARWLLPSGKSIDKNGVMSDFEIKDNPETKEVDEQLKKAKEILLK